MERDGLNYISFVNFTKTYDLVNTLLGLCLGAFLESEDELGGCCSNLGGRRWQGQQGVGEESIDLKNI